jgi:hypothetical protein
MGVEVDQMRIHIVEERSLRRESKRDGEPASERLNETPVSMRLIHRQQPRKEPPLASGPLQRGRKSIPELVIDRARLRI